jgi:hypothetical protein
VTEQEEATKHDNTVIPYHLWDSRLARLWDGKVIPPSDVAKAAEVIREQFVLRFWKLKVRIFFHMVQATLQGVHTTSRYGNL